jgi:hypothetical protein
MKMKVGGGRGWVGGKEPEKRKGKKNPLEFLLSLRSKCLNTLPVINMFHIRASKPVGDL